MKQVTNEDINYLKIVVILEYKILYKEHGINTKIILLI